MVKAKVKEIEDGTETKRKSKKLVHSAFLLTINPNVRTIKGSDDHAEHSRRLKELYQELFTEDNMSSVIRINRPNEDESFIKDVEITPVMEYGNKNKCLHLHIMIHVSHYTNISIDVTSMRKHILRVFPTAHVNIKFIKDYRELTMDYIRKNLNVDS